MRVGLCLVMSVGMAVAEDHDDDDEEDFGDRFFDDDTFFLEEGFPTILEHPIGQVLLPGDRLEFSVHAEGEPLLRYQWNRNGEIIDGAIEPELIMETVRPRDAGVYTVTVFNELWAVESFPADLVVATAPAAFSDDFEERSVLAGISGSVSGSNVGATRELDEPRHGGKAGGKTIWISWIAPNEGIATFDTSGSGFDTLLSIYEPELDELVEEFEFEDDGMFRRQVSVRENRLAEDANEFDEGEEWDSDDWDEEEGDEEERDQDEGEEEDEDEEDEDEEDEDEEDEDEEDEDEEDEEIEEEDLGVGIRPVDEGTPIEPVPVTEFLGIENLEEVGRDDDSEAFHASLVQFWAEAGRRYEIAIDGFAGATGPVVLNWSLLTANRRLPVILTTPGDRALNFGDPLKLSVNFQSTEVVELQWFRNGVPIEGANEATLEIPDFQPEHTGVYRLLIQLDEFRVFTGPIELQINSEGQSDVIARDKLPDAIESALTQSQAINPPALVQQQRLRKAAAGVSRGFTGSQVFNTILGSKDANEPLHCGLIGGASYWFAYEAPADGLLRINTNGSEFDTILAAYRILDPNLGFDGLAAVACDNNGGTDGMDSQVQFQVKEGLLYTVVIDGVNGAAGVVRLNYELANATVTSVASVSGPRLLARRGVDGQIVLSWSTSSGPHELLMKMELGSASWKVVETAPVSIGDQSEIRLPVEMGQGFFTLRPVTSNPSVASATR